jgi:hypothetical protein
MASSGTPTNSNTNAPVSQYSSGQNLPVPLYGGADMSVRTNYIGVQSELVVPFVAPMYADASGQVGVLQREDVTIYGIDDVFDVSCTLAQAADLLNAFTVTDVDQRGGLGLSAEVLVDFSGTTFATALAEIIAFADAGNSRDASNTNLHVYLRDETHADLLSALAHDALANMLEASDLNVEIALDASSGAVNMADELAGNGATSAARATQYRKAIFTQIPEYTIEQYLKVSDGSNNTAFEDVSGMNFMPLLVGDVLTFVFDVTVGQYEMASNNMPANGANMQRVFRDANTVYPEGTGNGVWNQTNDISFNQNVSGGYVDQAAVTYAPTSGLTFLAPTKRRVALKVHLGMRNGTAGNVFDLSAAINTPGAKLAATATNANGSVVA